MYSSLCEQVLGLNVRWCWNPAATFRFLFAAVMISLANNTRKALLLHGSTNCNFEELYLWLLRKLWMCIFDLISLVVGLTFSVIIFLDNHQHWVFGAHVELPAMKMMNF